MPRFANTKPMSLYPIPSRHKDACALHLLLLAVLGDLAESQHAIGLGQWGLREGYQRKQLESMVHHGYRCDNECLYTCFTVRLIDCLRLSVQLFTARPQLGDKIPYLSLSIYEPDTSPRGHSLPTIYDFSQPLD